MLTSLSLGSQVNSGRRVRRATGACRVGGGVPDGGTPSPLDVMDNPVLDGDVLDPHTRRRSDVGVGLSS